MAVYVVWLPALSFQAPSKLQENGVEAARIIPDTRARFYSDPKAFTGTAYGKLLNIPNGAPAWDIYFVFDADVRWENEPPKPYYWMHQLWGMDPKLLLNGPVFFEHVQKLLRLGSSPPNPNASNPGIQPKSFPFDVLGSTHPACSRWLSGRLLPNYDG